MSLITGKELYLTWCEWTDSDKTRKEPFVIQRDTWWGEERCLLVRSIERIPNTENQYEVKLFNHKFRPITLFLHDKNEFEIIEEGRFKALNWR